MLSWQEFVFEFSTTKLSHEQSRRTLFEAMRSIALFYIFLFVVTCVPFFCSLRSVCVCKVESGRLRFLPIISIFSPFSSRECVRYFFFPKNFQQEKLLLSSLTHATFRAKTPRNKKKRRRHYMPNFGRSKKTKKTTNAKALKKKTSSRRGSLGDALSELRLETTTEEDEEEEEERRKNEREKKKEKKKKGKTMREEETKKNASGSYRPPYAWLEEDEDEDIDSSVLPRVCTERDSNLAFEGFDITTFFGSERWQFESDVYGEDKVSRGNEKFSCSMMCGPKNEMVTFHFKSKVNLLKFQKRPRRYIPVCGGFCCTGVVFSTSPDSCCYDRLFRADPSKFARKDQKVYMFADEESKRYFLSYAKEMAEVCEEAFERQGFQENAEVCDGGYQSEYGHYSPFGKNFDGYPEHFN